MKAKSFTLSVSFPSSAEAVFSALTNTRQITIVLAYEVGKMLSFTWKPAEWTKENQSSIVTCLFKPTKNGSTLTVKHSGFPNDSEFQSHKDGWTEFVFDPLKMYLIAKQK